MSRAKSNSASRAPQTRIAAPTYVLSDAQLEPVLAALPPMEVGATPAWHRTRRAWVLKEIAALHPTDAAQAALAADVVLLRHHAVHLTGHAGQRGTTAEQAHRLGRLAAATAAASEQLARGLRQWQASVAPLNGPEGGDRLAWPVADARPEPASPEPSAAAPETH